MQRSIDFNCDLGEGCANDADVMPFISSANIACGAHAGDIASMRATLRLCAAHGVSAGAHPGYADREHFGRRALALSREQIRSLLHEQLERIAEIALAEGVALVHVKPHGALYNQAAADAVLADAIAEAVRAFDSNLILVGLAGSRLITAGLAHGLRIAHEAFTDRRYQSDGSLAPRGQPGAVIESVDAAIAQALAIVRGESIACIDGTALRVHADTLCLHGDGSDAAGFAGSLRAAFDDAGVMVRCLQR
ncbi:MAG: 5-oxoprolinase subunit PxpA [Dokdonella sp.]|jgi:5-oxoprolinase (ATP-hydrolysing) subunit A|uniref:5-oxoprolinase subunit PxpA n=1 Tax=Dokdonella sp. TaxID=2291710 RepID=UPI001B53F31F|nr:5-oxoprolinase subunit PxpA [Dokdonella sp.]MBK8122077.1 LamB/YcsF family protein [Dokdonella sp.]MBP6327492.1 LamB/YcsF family protein [Dokdonella sp.]MBP6330236.1 LamB/YcsF family protein [Dokdonella sp.]HNV07105.1 5-oxoprolinase subunit PxpA [Dokdonella sp.]HPW02825.1 5-oxoprolinase subunit PxpA [Dokdonella sp.]